MHSTDAGACFGTIEGCRSCGSQQLHGVLNLGTSPLADRLLTAADLDADEKRYPLELCVCGDCSLAQITYTVPPDELFGGDYPYFSSVSTALQEHTAKNVHELIASRQLGPGSLALEVASNDGYLLRHYKEAGIPVLGIDPAAPPAEAATAAGIETIIDYFTLDLAEGLAADGVQADVVHGNNVLAHVADTNGFVAGIKKVLSPKGVGVFEFPYVRDLIDHCEFDTIYHQHLCYFSVTSVDRLFRRHGLYLNEVRRLPIHGGSLRLYVEHRERVGSSVAQLLNEEENLGLTQIDFYREFGQRIAELRNALMALLEELQASKKRIAAYGAPAKGCTLLNYFDIDTNIVPYTVDKNVFKQGKFMPGTRQPIYSPEKLLEDNPDYVVLLPWNFADEILFEQRRYRANGGKFIVPIPELRVVS